MGFDLEDLPFLIFIAFVLFVGFLFIEYVVSYVHSNVGGLYL